MIVTVYLGSGEQVKIESSSEDVETMKDNFIGLFGAMGPFFEVESLDGWVLLRSTNVEAVQIQT